jgi:hypothetical protein
MKTRLLLGLAGALAVGLAGAGCRSTDPLDVYVSLPGVSPFAPGTFRAIIIASFRDEAPLPDFEAGSALEEALEVGLKSGTKGQVERVTRAKVPAVAGRDEAPVWKALGAAEEPGTIYLAGSIRMSGDIRKAIDRNVIAEGPFDLVGRLLAKRRWRLTVEVYVISAATGEALHHQTWSEYEDYNELDKAAEFAFSELSARVLDQLKAILFASPAIEVRTLLRR